MLRKIRKMLKHQEGFTLVELMIVVVILGILAGVGIQQYGRVQESARLGVDEANIRIIEGAARMFLMGEEVNAGADGAFTYTKGSEQEDFDIEALDTEGYLDGVPESPWSDGEYSIAVINIDTYEVEAYNSATNSEYNKPTGQ